jgi:ERI1 exoribonuclease 3
MSLDGKHHSGIDDCKNISKIVKRIIEDGHQNFKYNYDMT